MRRHVGAGEATRRGPEPPPSGNGEGAARGGGARKEAPPRRRADGLQRGAVQRLYPRGDRRQRRAGEGGGHQSGIGTRERDQANAIAPPTSAAMSAAMNNRRGPGSFLSRRKKPTGRGGRASSSRSRFVGAESRPSAAEESNCRDRGRRVSEPIARAAGARRVFSVSTSSFTVFVTS